MATSFEWKFEEEPPPGGPPRRPGRLAGRPWLRRGALTLLLLATAGLAFRAWKTHYQSVVHEAEAQLRAVVELELASISNGDTEVFRLCQDPGDPDWRQWQAAHYFYSDPEQLVPAPGLVQEGRALEIGRIQLSGRFGRVELVRWFRDTIEDAQLYPFEVTWHYRQDEDGDWYHVAPPAEYLRAPYLTIIAASHPVPESSERAVSAGKGPKLKIRGTQVEAALVEPIAPELSDLLARANELFGCTGDAEYTLVFGDTLASQVRGEQWLLPSMHVTGRPGDERARDAWQRAIKRWIAGALAQCHAGDADLSQRIMFRQLLQRAQARLGLGTAPVPDVALLARALSEGRQHSVGELWAAVVGGDDPENTRLLEAETAALLELISGHVGKERLFKLFGALGSRYEPREAALFTLYHLDRQEFTASWYAYLSELTGVELPPLMAFPVIPPIENPSEPPPPPGAPLGEAVRVQVYVENPFVPPPPPNPIPGSAGKQIALACGGRIWISNADGTALYPLTEGNQHLATVEWPTGGRWLVTQWIRDSAGAMETAGSSAVGTYTRMSVPYVVAADGGEAHLLTSDPRTQGQFLTFSPDGRYAVYVTIDMQARLVDLKTGETRQLPGVPFWSLDGQHLVYQTQAPSWSLWLADADWRDPRQLDVQAGLWYRMPWAPDSAKLALITVSGESPIAMYNLVTEQLALSSTHAELGAAFLSAGAGLVTDGSDPTVLAEQRFEWVRPMSWSADSQRLLVFGFITEGEQLFTALWGLAVVAFDGTPAQALALARVNTFQEATWSPTDPDRLVFTLSPAINEDDPPQTFVYDLRAGLIYAAENSDNAQWSPDGNWLAFVREGEVVIADRDGHEQFTLAPGGRCRDVAWNPEADLSGLSGTSVTTPP